MEKIASIIVVVLVLVVLGGLGLLLRPKSTVDNGLLLASMSPPQEQALLPSPSSAVDIMPINSVVTATIQTSKGDIAITLDGTRAPLTVGNFVKLAQSGFYDGTTFHRVIPDFMIQGGDPLSKDPNNRPMVGSGDPGYKFKDEINNTKLVRGSLAMANSGPNTNGSQFFIVTAAATPWLDGIHTNFGEVTQGMDIVTAITNVKRDDRENPIEPVVIKKIIINDLAVSATVSPGASPDVSVAPLSSRSPALISPQAPRISPKLLISPNIRQWPSPIMPSPTKSSAASPDDFGD